MGAPCGSAHCVSQLTTSTQRKQPVARRWRRGARQLSPMRMPARRRGGGAARAVTSLTRSGLAMRHAALQSGSLMSAPSASSCVAKPPSITAHPPALATSSSTAPISGRRFTHIYAWRGGSRWRETLLRRDQVRCAVGRGSSREIYTGETRMRWDTVGKGRLNLATSQAIQEAIASSPMPTYERGLDPGVGALADQPDRPGPR